MEKTLQLAAIRRYGITLLGTVGALFLLTFGVFWLVEKNEVRDELMRASRGLPQGAESAFASSTDLHLPRDLILLREQDGEHRDFYETSINGEDYLAYANPESHFIIAKSEAYITHESTQFAFLLTALFIGVVSLSIGWWLFVRERVEELFEE